MSNDPIHNARRAAKALSRSEGLAYQHALDVVARNAGFGTWGAMLAEQGRKSGSAPRPIDSVVAPSDWRLRALERLEGSRHSPVDEAGIASIGRPLARLAAFAGVPTLAVASTVPAAGSMVVAAMFDMSARHILVGVVITTYLVLVYGLATLRSPDHQGARRARRLSRILTTTVVVLSACFCIPIGYMYGGDSVTALWEQPLMIAIYGCWFTIAMWTCAWEGRRRRRCASTGT